MLQGYYYSLIQGYEATSKPHSLNTRHGAMLLHDCVLGGQFRKELTQILAKLHLGAGNGAGVHRHTDTQTQ